MRWESQRVAVPPLLGGILWFPCKVLSAGVMEMHKRGVTLVEGCRGVEL